MQPSEPWYEWEFMLELEYSLFGRWDLFTLFCLVYLVYKVVSNCPGQCVHGLYIEKLQ